MQTYCREIAPLVPREWSYEAENLQLYRYRQVLARMLKFFVPEASTLLYVMAFLISTF